MASKNNKCHELTEAEKRELTAKVYPALKNTGRKNPLKRLLGFSKVGIMMFFLVSCAAEKPVIKPEPADKTENALIIKNGMTKADDPKEFEMSMPETDIGLGLVYRYSKEATVTKISDNVIDFDFENGMLVLLKEDRLVTNVPSCLSIGLDKRYTSVSLSGGLALLNSAEKAVLADISKCGTVRDMDSRGRGFSLSEIGLLEFTKSGYTLYDRYKSEKKVEGTFIGGVIFGQFLKDKMLFATENGKFALIDIKTNKFSAINEGNIDFKEINATDSGIFVLTKQNKLLWLAADYTAGKLNKIGEAQGKDGCFMLKKSGFMYCDGYITGIDRAYRSPMEADGGIYTQGLSFLKKEDVLYFADSEPVYKKSVVFGKSGNIELCLKDGKTYFKDFDGHVRYFTAEGSESKAEKYPDECDHKFSLKGGVLKSADGKTIYKYADSVSQSAKAVMYKRILGQEIYYYFEPR